MGFFGLVGCPKVSTEEACSSCRPCGTGFPAPIQGSITGVRAARFDRVPNAWSAQRSTPLTPVARAKTRAAELQCRLKSPLNLDEGARP